MVMSRCHNTTIPHEDCTIFIKVHTSGEAADKGQRQVCRVAVTLGHQDFGKTAV